MPKNYLNSRYFKFTPKFFSWSVFGEPQLRQIWLNFKTSCYSLIIRGLGRKLREVFLFMFHYPSVHFSCFILIRTAPHFFMSRTLSNITHDRRRISKFSQQVFNHLWLLQWNVFSSLKKYWLLNLSSAMFKLGNFLTEYFWETSYLVNISKANFSYVFLSYPMLKFFFKKMKLFLEKGFYLNIVKLSVKVKCILNVQASKPKTYSHLRNW